jgi:PRC-barrel domain
MLRTLFAVGLLSAALAAAPGSAQQSQPTPAAPSSQPDAQLVGLPVYSNDGQKLGDVTEVGTFGGRRMLRAEIGTFLGLGPTPVLIPTDAFQQKADRIEVAMSAEEVRDTISRQTQKRPEK